MGIDYLATLLGSDKSSEEFSAGAGLMYAVVRI